MKNTTNINEILGKKIKSILQTKWDIYEDTESCEVFVLLENDFLFEISFVDNEFEEFPIVKKDLGLLQNLVKAEFLPNTPECVGDKIENIVVSEYWPTFGIELSSKKFLYARDWGTPFKFGAFIEPISEESAQDVYIYGGKQRLITIGKGSNLD